MTDDHNPHKLLLEMARDWTAEVVVRDSPARAADVIAQLIAVIESLVDDERALCAEIARLTNALEKIKDIAKRVTDE
jgi:hypothetical protein